MYLSLPFKSQTVRCGQGNQGFDMAQFVRWVSLISLGNLLIVEDTPLEPTVAMC